MKVNQPQGKVKLERNHNAQGKDTLKTKNFSLEDSTLSVLSSYLLTNTIIFYQKLYKYHTPCE